MPLRRFNGESGEIPNYDYGWRLSDNFRTDISEMFGGGEQRRARWDRSLRKVSLPFNNKRFTSVKALRDFYKAHKGAYGKFLFYTAETMEEFSIADTYKVTSGGFVDKLYLPYRYIYPMDTAPDTEQVIIKVNTVLRTADYTVNQDEGSITFTANKPADTDTITVEYSYYMVMRFAQDNLEFSEKTYNVYDTTFELTEVR